MAKRQAKVNVAPLQGERHGFAVPVVSQPLPQFMLACHLLITLRLNAVLLFIAGADHHGTQQSAQET
ncbi:hypothetical protein DJ252_23575 [Salmonella enterica subsp. enterica serovar Uzaramo]|nr:hypothetical protein [Salmonella enterica subsp. enterica serovar Bredeney]EEE9947913.1 hypothetical protein [Salmonella enterica subsp. enterica serovar Uzaramo]EEM9513142.1 hypothetical protein [Salmonella enterica]EBY2600190.1 hypothetical protein [Salmonella enterica subsp. enterica serovar Bredeney]EHP5749475.1 hypothetical protein [Salmonella enterica]